MAVYRVRKRLSTGQQRGDVVQGGDFRQGVVPALLRVGALAYIDGPPLTELPGWELRGETLAAHGIETVVEFLEADEERVRQWFNYRSCRAVERWKDEVRRWLMPPPEDRG